MERLPKSRTDIQLLPADVYQHEFQKHDRRLLVAFCRGSAEELWAEAQRVEDRFNVCSLAAPATLLEILPGVPGQILDYNVWHEEATRAPVSFAVTALA